MPAFCNYPCTLALASLKRQRNAHPAIHLHRRLKPACCMPNPSHRSLLHLAWISMWLLVPQFTFLYNVLLTIRRSACTLRTSRKTHHVPSSSSILYISASTITAGGQHALHSKSHHYHGFPTKWSAEASQDEGVLRRLLPCQGMNDSV